MTVCTNGGFGFLLDVAKGEEVVETQRLHPLMPFLHYISLQKMLSM